MKAVFNLIIIGRGSAMNFENPARGLKRGKEDEIKAPSSRLTDEKISDASGTEATADEAMAPAGLKNPFWN
jgi:hypothetical protein